MTNKSKLNIFLTLILLQFAVNALIFFDVPVAKQIIGFAYFTIIPGLLIIQLMNLEGLDKIEILVFSVGGSIAFLMFAGLLINDIGLLFGLSNPLSLMPLMIILNAFIVSGGVLVYLRSGDVILSMAEVFRLFPSALPLIVPPVLSVVGVMWVNAFSNNMILLLMLIVVPSLVVIAVVSKKWVPPKLYPFAVLMIAISLLFHSSLISAYIYRGDVHMEYFVSKTTQNNSYWSSTNPFGDIVYGRLYSMLSVTILPTIYSTLLNMDSTFVFKIIFPLIFSFVPLALYQVWKEYVGKKYAFISGFLFMAYETFFGEMLGVSRQMIAELFFVLLLFVVLSNKMKLHSKMMCYMIFSFGLVVSHYGLSEIFLLFISLAFVALVVARRPSRTVTASMVVLFFVIMFTWYIYTSNSAAFQSLLSFGDYVYSQLGEFFEPASRGQTVLRGMGLESPPTIWNTTGRAFAYITQFLIAVGFVGLVTKRVKVHFGREYFTFSLTALAFLAALVLVPGLASTMNMTRFYHVLLFFLPPFCVIGAETIVRFVSKQRIEFGALILLLIVLVPYFLFQTGFVYEVAGVQSWSVPLSKYRMDRLFLSRYYVYVDEPSVVGAKWMSKNIDVRHRQIYADVFSRYNVLTSYGLMYPGGIIPLLNTTIIAFDGILYLSQLNVAYGRIAGENNYWNSTDFSPLLNGISKVYSNGECDIYRSVP